MYICVFDLFKTNWKIKYDEKKIDNLQVMLQKINKQAECILFMKKGFIIQCVTQGCDFS